MSATNKIAVLALLSLLVACTHPLDTQKSGINPPIRWSLLSKNDKTLYRNTPIASTPSAVVDQRWWRHFKDPTLTILISDALKNNQSLGIAQARIEEARAARTFAYAKLLPQVSGEVYSNRGNEGYFTNDQVISQSQVDIQAAWEFDLFGKNQLRTAAATAILQSTEASQKAVRVALFAEVARAYFDLRNFERQIHLTQRNLISQKKTLELTEEQQRGALVSELDVQRAAAQVSTTEALIPPLQDGYQVSLNRLNVLLGSPPGTKDMLLKTTRKFKSLDHKIVIIAPAKVLATRPDVHVAERNFAASISTSCAATRELLPDISLTALLGVQSATPFSSMPWGWGVNVMQPILNFGRIRSLIDTANARQKQAFLVYQQAVLRALEDMENALSGYIHETIGNASLAKSVRQNQTAVKLAMLQYKNGYIALLDVLIAERNLLVAESSKAASDFKLRKDLVNIYTAAGGGWSNG